MKRILNILPVLFFVLLSQVIAAQDFPERSNPPRLVNDINGLLTPQEQNALENKLVAFNDSTSTQIAVVIIDDLKGYEIADYAQQLAEKWGIGQKGKNNGVIVLVKTKSGNSKGEANISPGYGLEGAIPDILCGEIIDNEMIPAFRNNDYYTGLDKATNTLMSLARGEFTADDYRNRHKGKDNPLGAFIPILIIIIIAVISGSGRSNNRHIGSKGLPFWMLMSMMNSRGSHGGSWGGFSGGGGSFGGGGGGFGGFGGGSFGGGGASGSW